MDLEPRGGDRLTEQNSEVFEAAYGHLVALFGASVTRVTSAPVAEVRLPVGNGSAITYVSVLPIGADETLVRSVAWVLHAPDQGAEMFRDLLRRNCKAAIGGYFIDEEGNVGFSHAIVGSDLSESELYHSVYAVARQADEDDDDLQARYGGSRAIDNPPAL